MRVIGLTGGIASGKSTVAKMFAALGAKLIDADLLARQVVEPGTPGLAQVAARFPDCVVNGVLDRKKLGARVFADPAERAALNAIIHPLIAQAAMARTAELADAGEKAVIYEAALIVENKLDAGMDGLIVVSVPEDVQVARLRARENLGGPEAKQRLAAQLPLSEKLARATWIVDNSGDVERTREQVSRIWREISGSGP
ncbi:MAG: dephospho-CoA kinase [Deltaproteobacteria bacterium]|nr:dephospho-CoA kinase [Deltaproteobacteria bacterium]